VVGCGPLESGKWYYEVEILTEGVAQVGWASDAFGGDDAAGDGVGDDAHSFAFDGCRRLKWTNGTSEAYGEWQRGDVVGCSLDLDARTIAFSRNGTFLGFAFQDLDGSGFFAALSLEDDEAVKVSLSDLRHKPPDFTALGDNSLFATTTTRTTSAVGTETTPDDDDDHLSEEKQESAAPPAADVVAVPDVVEQDEPASEPPPPPVRAPVVPEALDLDAISSVEELAALGLDRLKAALAALGCKCGGTLQDRAKRLWSTKDKPRAEWDPKILAKKPKAAAEEGRKKEHFL